MTSLPTRIYWLQCHPEVLMQLQLCHTLIIPLTLTALFDQACGVCELSPPEELFFLLQSEYPSKYPQSSFSPSPSFSSLWLWGNDQTRSSRHYQVVSMCSKKRTNLKVEQVLEKSVISLTSLISNCHLTFLLIFFPLFVFFSVSLRSTSPAEQLLSWPTRR